MKKVLIVLDIVLRVAFAIFATYVMQRGTFPDFVSLVGASMLAFNLITTFFDKNYYDYNKNKKP